jgi:hypothetical protein
MPDHSSSTACQETTLVEHNKNAKDQTKPIYSLSLPPQTGDGESQTHDADFIKST